MKRNDFYEMGYVFSCLGSDCFVITVTTVDSGSKALKFLGFQEDEQSNPDTPFGSPNNHQVKFRFSFGSLSNVRDSSSFLIFFHLF